MNHLVNQNHELQFVDLGSSLERSVETATYQEASYTEEIIESTVTLYSTSSSEYSEETEDESETETQMQRRLSEILSNLRYSRGSIINLSQQSSHCWEDSVRLSSRCDLNKTIDFPKISYFSVNINKLKKVSDSH